MAVVWRQWVEGFDTETEEAGCTTTIDTGGSGFDKNKVTSVIASASDSADRATADVTTAAWLPGGSEGRMRFKFKPLSSPTWNPTANVVFLRIENIDPVQLIEIFAEADEKWGIFSQAATLRSTSSAEVDLGSASVADTEYTIEVAWRGATDSTGFRRMWIDEVLVAEVTGYDMVNADDCDVLNFSLGFHHYDGASGVGLACEIRMAQLSDDASTALTDPTSGTYTIVNGSDETLTNVNATGDDVAPGTYKDGVALTETELAAIFASFGQKDIAVFADLTGDAQARQRKLATLKIPHAESA